jgi:DNA-binding FadR family transcriptional regulator
MLPIRKSSTHELIRDRLKRAIHLGDYLPGDRLPSERDMASQLEVSRVTLREAIKTLEEEGYLVTRRGATGGLRVTALAEPAARMRRDVSTDQQYLEDLCAYRRTIECGAARLAAARRTRADVARIAAAVRALEPGIDMSRFRKVDTDFHRAVAAASHNRFFVDAVEDVRQILFLLFSGTEHAVILPSTLEAHTAILAAIKDGDVQRAEAAMAAHVEVAYQEMSRDFGFSRAGTPPRLR